MQIPFDDGLVFPVERQKRFFPIGRPEEFIDYGTGQPVHIDSVPVCISFSQTRADGFVNEHFYNVDPLTQNGNQPFFIFHDYL
jgi:hypothetical protein